MQQLLKALGRLATNVFDLCANGRMTFQIRARTVVPLGSYSTPRSKRKRATDLAETGSSDFRAKGA